MRLYREFSCISHDPRLDALFDEAKTIAPSTRKYWLGMPLNWNYHVKGRLTEVGLSIAMAWLVPCMMAIAGLAALVQGDVWLSLPVVLLSSFMFISFSGLTLQGCVDAEKDSEYALFRAWFLTDCRKRHSVVDSVDSLGERLLYFVQRSEPEEFARKRIPIAAWSKRFFVASITMMAATFIAAAMGAFVAGSPIPLVLFAVMMALLFLGFVDLAYEMYRIPILSVSPQTPLPRRKYGTVDSTLSDVELSAGFNSRKTLYLAKLSATFMLILGWPFAWTIDGIGFVALAESTLYVLIAIVDVNLIAQPILVLGSLISIGLLGYTALRAWHGTGLKEALGRKSFFQRLASVKSLSEVIKEDDLVDAYYFGMGESEDDPTADRRLAARILIACIGAFRRPKALAGDDGRIQTKVASLG